MIIPVTKVVLALQKFLSFIFQLENFAHDQLSLVTWEQDSRKTSKIVVVTGKKGKNKSEFNEKIAQFWDENRSHWCQKHYKDVEYTEWPENHII